MTVQTVFNLGEYRIITIMTGEPWKENCYLVTYMPSGEQALIDPGDDPDFIIQAVLDSGARLRYILLTHAHHDHVGAVAALCRRFDLPCDVHKGDARLLRHAPMYAWRFAGKQIEPPKPFRVYEDQPTFQLGQQRIEVIHTPGHTYGSVCYYFGDFVFTGDTLLYQHVGRTDLPGANADQLAVSVSQLVERLPGDVVIFPGHGQKWTLAEAQAWWQDAVVSPPQYNQFGI